MPSLPIAPDESGDVPRCWTGCGHFDIERRQRGPDWYDEDGVCRHESAMREPGDICLPRVRELVALSRRRCDGCHRYEPTTTRHDGTCPMRVGVVPAHGHCEEWEAKP